MQPLEAVWRQRTSVILLFCTMMAAGCFAPHTVTQVGDEVELYYWYPEAWNVFCVTSVNQFKREKALSDGRGGWVCRIASRAEFSYFFVVDGKISLPECEATVMDDFGGRNCIYEPSL